MYRRDRHELIVEVRRPLPALLAVLAPVAALLGVPWALGIPSPVDMAVAGVLSRRPSVDEAGAAGVVTWNAQAERAVELRDARCGGEA